ncbi:DUF2059 domain-containing protein [Ottowia sp.]|uniref:DUF2059 domain-containing protein n=1 Tax=Ottowia sp. TaxID=1898956 RepID=UPI0039E35BA0
MSTGASAQNDAKRTLALKLAQMQQKADGPALAEQLTASAVQPLLVNWSQRLDESVPPARQKEVRDKLDVELKKFAESTEKIVEGQVAKAAEAALVPIFMEKLTEDDMKTIIAYMESPVSAKFQALGPEASNAWAKRVVDATKSQVESGAKSFDAAANRIVGSAGGASSSGNAAPKK